MQVAALNNSFDCEAWLAANTAYCQRHRCRLTVADCDQQRRNSQDNSGDLRCQGCGGLHYQPEAIDEIGGYGKATPRHLKLVTSPVSADDEAALDPFAIMLLSILKEKDDSVDAEFEPVEEELDYDDAVIEEDDLDKEVMRLFPELREFIEECAFKPSDVENKDQKGRVGVKSKQHKDKCAVYIGRCKRCKGYMVNTLERHDGIKDDDVHRCFTCGWRTSPDYNYNRLHIRINY